MIATLESERAAAPAKETAAHFTNQKKSNGLLATSQARFDESTIQDLRDRLPEYLEACGHTIRKQGSRLVTHCPMHDDSKPSFAMFGNKHENGGCYPCNFKGDVFGLARAMGKANSFPDAVRHVASVLGISLRDQPQSPAQAVSRVAKPIRKPAHKPEPELTADQLEIIRKARLRFSDALHSGNPLVEKIADSLGLKIETLRYAAFGESGLGLACPAGSSQPWLCYAYPSGLKWRNPHPQTTPRFRWITGNARKPWRWEWVKPNTQTIYLTESESDCMALIEAGIDQLENTACVAMPGTSWQEHWIELFRGKRVVLCMDKDKAGTAATALIAAQLKGIANEILTVGGFEA
jgi:hypothetical protein